MTEASNRSVLATGRNRLGTEIRLTHRTAGLQPAGSRPIPVSEAWGVLWTLDNASHGQWFETESAARAFYDSRNVA